MNGAPSRDINLLFERSMRCAAASQKDYILEPVFFGRTKPKTSIFAMDQGRDINPDPRDIASVHVAFRAQYGVGITG